MTLDEKINQFYTAAIESATSQNIKIIDEYNQSLQNIYNDHKEDVLRKTEISYLVESSNVIREKNRNLSSEAIKIKRIVSEKSMELTTALFQDVAEQLNIFMKTPDYIDLLSTQVIASKEFAREDEVTIYINTTDEALKTSLESKTGITLTVSTTNFIGGTRAVLHAKSILIDNSFISKLAEAKNNFML